MRMPIKKEMLLQFKLEDILDFMAELPPVPPLPFHVNTATATAQFEGVTYTDTDSAHFTRELVEEENNNIESRNNKEVNKS